MKEKFFVLLIFCFLFLMSKSIVFALNGPHKITCEKGECAICHIPHNAQGIKIWKYDLKDVKFGGVRRLCRSCHDGSYTIKGEEDYNDLYDLPGQGNVFDRDAGADHVMHGGACLEPGPYPLADSLRDESDPEKYKDKYEDDPFLLDPDDEDTVPYLENGTAHGRVGMNYKKGKAGWGFYCGSCHDVHNDGGAAYLRYKNNYEGSDKWNNPAFGFSIRKTFCSQCHSVPHAEDRDCMECHAPHRGATVMDSEKEEIARWILLEEVGEVEFASIGAVFPNEDNKLPNNTPFAEKPSVCYGCHRQGSAYGDSIATISSDKCYHHPMGLFATKNNSPRAEGTYDAQRGADYPGVGAWDRNEQLDCLSCHTYHKVNEYCEEGDNNSYLRWNFKNDSPDFCVKCHNDKTDLDRLGKGDTKDDHRQAKSTSFTDREVFDNGWKTVPSKDCMFCHYIHDGKTDGRIEEYAWSARGISITNLSTHTPADKIPPELDALMRVPAKILLREWADNNDRDDNSEPKNYEDMCYGCHGRESIVIKQGEGGSLLRPDKYFSHRYAVDPNDSKNPYSNMTAAGTLFPVSDGDATDVVDDYGVDAGAMYCGSCHNVHDTTIKPYLNGKATRHEPYRAYPIEADGFCQGCHQGDHPAEADWIDRTHPVSKDPSSITLDTFYKNSKYRQGGDGKKGAVFDNMDNTGTAKIICLSCHNVHAAMTNWDGTKAKNNFDDPSSEKESPGHGMLLVIDNNVDDAQKSDMCIQCHPM